MDTSRLRTPSGARLNGGTPKASRSPPWRRQKNLEGQEKFQGVFEFFCCKDPGWLTLCVRAPVRRLTSRVPQRGFQPPPFLVPPDIFGLQFLLESVHFQLDGRGSLRMLPLSCFQRRLRLVDGLLAAFTLLLPGDLFARPFTLAPFLLLFEGESGLSLRCLVDRTGGRLLRLMAFRLPDGFRRSFAVAQIGG